MKKVTKKLLFTLCDIFNNPHVLNINFWAEAVSRYGSGSGSGSTKKLCWTLWLRLRYTVHNNVLWTVRNVRIVMYI
jgi:hypothetical protein